MLYVIIRINVHDIPLPIAAVSYQPPMYSKRCPVLRPRLCVACAAERQRSVVDVPDTQWTVERKVITVVSRCFTAMLSSQVLTGFIIEPKGSLIYYPIFGIIILNNLRILF